MGSRARRAAPLAAVIVGLVIVPTAHAAFGDISFAGCVSASSNATCAHGGGADGLDGPFDVASSPDGRDLYVAGINGNTLVHLRRGATGDLTPAECFSQNAHGGCTQLASANVMVGPEDPTVSPDGTDVYVASVTSGDVTHFKRDPATGDLTFANCTGNSAPCAIAQTGGPQALAMSPDGANVYVAGGSAKQVARMARAANGDLTLGNCVKSAAPGGSCTLPASTVTDFDVVLGIAAAANGRDIYVTSNTGRSVLHFVQAPGGDISFADCVSEAGNAPCDAVGTGRLNQVVGVDVSDDGRSVYTGAAGTSNALARFDVLAGGALNLTFCFSQSGVNCGSPSAPNSLAGARGVDVTPDGRNVYVAGGTGNAMSIWNRTPDTGFISFVGCSGRQLPAART